MKLFVVAFGKLKTPGIRETTDYYLRNVRPWAKIEEIELKPIPVPDKSEAIRENIRARELAILNLRIEKILPQRGQIWILDESGQNLSTVKWADTIQKCKNESVPAVVLLIGSSLGFGDAIRKKADLVISLGKQTTSHEIARLQLVEQIYRAYSLLNGHPYHNP